jgi:hypothetical protein
MWVKKAAINGWLYQIVVPGHRDPPGWRRSNLKMVSSILLGHPARMIRFGRLRLSSS